MRCKMVFEGRLPDPAVVVSQVLQLVKDCSDLQATSSGHRLQQLPSSGIARRPADHLPRRSAAEEGSSTHSGVSPDQTSTRDVDSSIHAGVPPTISLPTRLQSRPEQQHQIPGGSARVTVDPLWVSPGQGVVKVNCDAAWDPSSGLGGIGVVARDNEGRLLGGFHCSESAHSSVFLEAKALFFGIKLTLDNR